MTRDITDNEKDIRSAVQRIGPYVVLQVIGKGGMGEVYKAFDHQHQRTVAIKTLGTESSADAGMLTQFDGEARAIMVLDHPNIAKLYSMEVSDEGRPFLVMEFIEGYSLEAFLDKNPDAEFSLLVDVIIQAARGLEAALRRSIIHRDIKPSNLILTHSGQVKIIDFGLAKSLWEQAGKREMVVGTPRYIAPEQAIGRMVDHRSDIYSLGATFYHLVTRKAPFDGDTAMSIMFKHVNTPLEPPYVINPLVPNDISEIICRMMQKNPAHRYQQYEPLIRELEDAKIRRLAKERRMAGQAPPFRETVETSSAVSVDVQDEQLSPIAIQHSQEPASASHKATLIVSVLGLLAVAALGIAMLISSPSKADEAKQSWASYEEMARQDGERIQQTRRKMEAVVAKIIDYRKRPGETTRIPMIRDLRSAGLVNEEQSRDEWGNDLVVTSARGGLLIAPGRDGLQGTEDDLVFTLDAMPQQVPKAKTAEEFAPAGATRVPRE